MSCSFGIFLSLLTLLLVFTFLYIFYGIYLKTKRNRSATEKVTPTKVFLSLLKDDNDSKEYLSEISELVKYSWPDSKASGIGGPIQLPNPDVDNFVLNKNNDNNWINQL
tara:strand:+ start:151 stop:477 length:327 start_codon:yes stop_codon:yes gene_type:complete